MHYNTNDRVVMTIFSANAIKFSSTIFGTIVAAIELLNVTVT